MSNDSENEYFCDGITEEIINALTTITGLKVIARTSSFAYKGKNIDLRDIGKELGVTSILEGSTRFHKSRVRITAQLINTKNGFHYWSHNFDRELEDIFELQDEISLLIADKIRENFGHLEVQDSLVPHPKISTNAYSLFLRASSLISKFNKEAIDQGIELLQQIIQDFPDYAPAFVKMHYAYNILAAAGLMPTKEALDIGTIFLNKAHQLNDQLPEVYHSKGWNTLNKDWDFISAVQYLKKALELQPNYADAHQKLFITLILEGNLKEADYHVKQAWSLDPLNDLSNYFMAYNSYIHQDFYNTNLYFKKCFELNNQFIVGYSINALALVDQQKAAIIFDLADRIPDIKGADLEKMQMRAIAHAAMHQVKETQELIDHLLDYLKTDHRERVRFFLVYVYTLLEKPSFALDLIDEGISYREPLMTLLKVDPLLKPLHNSSRFQKQLDIIYQLSNKEEKKDCAPAKQLLDQEQVVTYKSKLKQSMETDQNYLDPALSLRKLAENIHIHPNQLSWLLNESFQKNFNEFVNKYRLNHFKNLVLQPASKNITIIGLAYDSGFNSKSVFNTFFKKEEGLTPSQWVHTQKN